MKLKTTPAMRARCRELTRQGDTDDYDRVVQMLLDDVDLLLNAIGQKPVADVSTMLDRYLALRDDYRAGDSFIDGDDLAEARAEVAEALLSQVQGALKEAVEFASQDFQALTPAGDAMVNRWNGLAQKEPSNG